LTLSYSLYLKRKLLIDVHVLAGLYTVRILAGGVAVGVVCSPWLLAFSMFLFLSLALVKRFADLGHLEGRADAASTGRGYQDTDRQVLACLGSASGLLCVLVLALYINSPQVEALYRTPAALWLLCPLIMYWVARMWIIAARGRMNADPVVFAVTDRVSFLVGACAGLVVFVASRHWAFLLP
jgi:4-hydroxybenzoate polyprenyltransferase